MKENVFKSLRKKNHLTQNEVAEKLGIKQSSISRWEQGLTIPDIAILTKLADLYGVSIDYLLGRENLTQSITTDEEYTILGRGGGRIKISKEQQEVINTLLDSFTKDKKE